MNTSRLTGPAWLAFPWLAFLALMNAAAFAAEDHDHVEEHAMETDLHGEHVEIPAELAATYGIRTAIAGPGEIRRSLLLYGRTRPDPQQISHITARYPGIILQIGPSLGESVAAGDEIARIQANNSLQTYTIEAPISGLVVDRHANPGEATADTPLMTLADYDRLWVDLSVFPGDASVIRPGQPVIISNGSQTGNSSIAYLNPGDGTSPAVIARVPLDNPAQLWTPGLLVEGQVEIASDIVDLRVEQQALQTVEGSQVVFVRVGDSYEIRPLQLGRRDAGYVEVLEGLAPGDEYVTENSYILKADLEKDGAGHQH